MKQILPQRKEARAKGHQVYEVTLARAPSLSEMTKGFDVIFLGRGLERFEEPRFSLRQLALLLDAGGFLILSTPNLDSEGVKRLGPTWPYWKPEENRFIYSKKSLRGILALSGFMLTKVWTVSSQDPSAPGLPVNPMSDPIAGEPADLAIERRLEGLTPSSQWLRNNRGEGDLIFAISRRVS